MEDLATNDADARPSGTRPGVSIVMTCYNHGRFIRAAVISCLQQDYDGPLELIIVDDCSTDGSGEIIRHTLRETPSRFPVRLVSTTKNAGVAGATDLGWKLARHEWICMADGDDIQLPERCSLLADLAEKHPEVRLIQMSAVNIDENNQAFGHTCYQIAPYEEAPEFLLLSKPGDRARNWLWQTGGQRMNTYGCSMAAHRSLFLQWGPLATDGGGRYTQDATWEFRAMLSAPVLGSRRLAARYRMHGTNLQNRSWHTESWRGIAEKERFYAGHQVFMLASIKHMQRDLEKAENTPGLTDWTPDELDAASRRLAIEENACLLRRSWWDLPWPLRLWRCIRYVRHIPPAFRTWGWARLLPLPLFCRLKTLKSRRKA